MARGTGGMRQALLLRPRMRVVDPVDVRDVPVAALEAVVEDIDASVGVLARVRAPEVPSVA